MKQELEKILSKYYDSSDSSATDFLYATHQELRADLTELYLALLEENKDMMAALEYIGHECMNNETCPPRKKMITLARAVLKKYEREV